MIRSSIPLTGNQAFTCLHSPSAGTWEALRQRMWNELLRTLMHTHRVATRTSAVENWGPLQPGDRSVVHLLVSAPAAMPPYEAL